MFSAVLVTEKATTTTSEALIWNLVRLRTNSQPDQAKGYIFYATTIMIKIQLLRYEWLAFFYTCLNLNYRSVRLMIFVGFHLMVLEHSSLLCWRNLPQNISGLLLFFRPNVYSSRLPYRLDIPPSAKIGWKGGTLKKKFCRIQVIVMHELPLPPTGINRTLLLPAVRTWKIIDTMFKSLA